MKTSVHIPADLASRLTSYLENSDVQTTKNKILVEALTEYLDKLDNKVDWSPKFLSWAEGETEEGLEIDRSDSFWREVSL